MKKDEKAKNKIEDKKKQIAKNNTKNFKQKYFAFYDDVKHYTNGKEDWWYSQNFVKNALGHICAFFDAVCQIDC